MELGRLIPIIFTLASRNLFHDRIRLIATLVGIVFSVVLFTVQLGLFLGFQRMVTTMIDHASADLWIAPADTKGFEATALLEGRERFRALAVPGVADVTPVMIGFTYWRKPNGKSQTPVFLVGTAPGGCSRGISSKAASPICRRPRRSPSTAPTSTDLAFRNLGDYGEIGDKKARVAAVTSGIRSFTTTPYMFMPLDRARAFLGVPPSSATYFLVRTAPGASVNEVQQRLAAALPNLEIITSDEFRRRSRSYWLFGTGAGAALFGSAILGVVVGTVIVAQTLYSSTKDHLIEFATLRAIGSSRRYLYQTILWQALLTAIIGFALAACGSSALARLTTELALPIVVTPTLIVALFALTVAMSIVSAISAIVVVTRVDPVTVLAR